MLESKEKQILTTVIIYMLNNYKSFTDEEVKSLKNIVNKLQ